MYLRLKMEIVNTDKYFRVFKINNIKLIGRKELKRRWKILVKKYHPDKGGNPAHFRFVNDAYQYLLNLIIDHEKIENKKFFNKNFLFYGDGSIYDITKKSWVKLKGKRIKVKT